MHMLRFPLHVPILLITTGGKFIGRVIHACDKVIRVVDVVERIINTDGDFLHTDNELSGTIYFNRDQIVGFKPLDNTEMYLDEQEYTNNILETYNDIVAQQYRTKFKIVKPVNSSKKNNNFMERKND